MTFRPTPSIQTSPTPRYPGTMIYKPKFADEAHAMCRLGATDEELAEHFGVCVRTIYRWRNTHEEFAEAVVVGKEHADARVERALYSRAVGCSVERTRVFMGAGDAKPVYATYRHHFPPDTSAALHWLRVRQPNKWGIGAPEDDPYTGRKALAEAIRRTEQYEAAKAAAQREQSAPRPAPMPEAPDTDPDLEPDADLDDWPDDDPVAEPVWRPDEDPASHMDPARPPVQPPPGPKPTSRQKPPPPSAFPSPPQAAAAPKPVFMPLPRFQRGGFG